MNTIKNTPEMLILRIDANDTLANAIRRSVAEVPNLAIDEVEIHKNDSASYDEILAHRLGLVPIKKSKGMNEKTKVEFKLSKVGPCTVYASDLEGDSEIVEPKIPITILGKEHKLELLATAVLGKGIQHAKFTPGLCYYRHILEIKSTPDTDKIIQKSSGLIKAEKKGSKWICDLSDADVTEIESYGKELVSNSEEMILVIESYGNMPAKDILTEAISALEDNLDEVEKALK